MDEWLAGYEGVAWEKVSDSSILIWCDRCPFRFVTNDLDTSMWVRGKHIEHEHGDVSPRNAYDMAKHRSKTK